MNLINPIGRTLASVATGITPRACMCSSDSALQYSNFSDARGTNDNCLHCGCECSGNSNYSSGNSSAAVTAVWKS